MNTAEKIFGAYDDAKALWSELADELYGVFVEGGNFRNDILKTWNELAARADLFKRGEENQGAFWNLYDAVMALVNTVKGSFRDIFPKSLFSSYEEQVKDIANRFKLFTERLKQNTKRISDVLKILAYPSKKLFIPSPSPSKSDSNAFFKFVLNL